MGAKWQFCHSYENRNPDFGCSWIPHQARPEQAEWVRNDREEGADQIMCFYARQSQFAGGVSRDNISNNNSLRRFKWVQTAKKQSQFKANRRPLGGNPKAERG